MGRPRKIEIRVHPLLDELRPRLKRPARASLEKSLIRVGQLNEVLVTADGYILDGRERYELIKADGQLPRIYWLTMHSGIGDMPPGYDREDELQMCRDVIEETGRRKWRDSGPKREPEVNGTTDQPEANGTTDQPEANGTTDQPEVNGTTDQPEVNGTINQVKPSLDLISLAPAGDDSSRINLRIPRQLYEHLSYRALVAGCVNNRSGRTKLQPGNVNEYCRRLFWQDYLNHLQPLDLPDD